MKEHEETIEKEQPYTIVFTNCGPKLTTDKLKTLVSHKLGIPFIFKSKDKLLQLKPDGSIVQLESNPVKESDLQITRVYFSSDNYRHFDKETYKYVETEKDIYRNKVGFVVLNKEVTEEMVHKCKVIRTKDRTLFGNFTIHDSINKTTALYVVHIRPTTDLQRLLDYIQKCCDNYQKTNEVTNMKCFYENQTIKGFLYVEMREALNEAMQKKLYNKELSCPNQVKILKCVSEKKAQKNVERVKKNKAYLKSVERKQAAKSNIDKEAKPLPRPYEE